MSEWIKVCGEEGGNPIEVETEDGNEIFYIVLHIITCSAYNYMWLLMILNLSKTVIFRKFPF